MRATLRITWLILSLGFLCHNVCSNTSAETKIQTSTSPTAVTSMSSTATTLSVTTIQNITPTHNTAAVTPITVKTEVTSKGTESSTVTQPVRMSTTQNQTYNEPSTKVTSSTSTAVTTDLFTNMTTTTMPYSSNSPISAAPVPTEAVAVPSVSSETVAHVTAVATEAVHPTKEIMKPPITNLAPAMSQKGSTESNDPRQKHTTVTSVASTIMGVSSTPLSERTQPSSTKTPDLLQKTTVTNTITTTTTPTTTITTTPITTTTTTTIPNTSPPLVFYYSHNTKEESTDKNLEEVCKKLMVNFAAGNCTLKYYKHNGTVKINSVETNGKVNASVAQQYYEEITTKLKDNRTLIAILASCIALLIMIVILAACASHHRKPYNENQQHLTEELQTVENGYHDNPTLEVMEVQPEMQEKKVALNGEFNDSWIVPFDNLLKEDIPDEEDTHL